MKKSPWVERFAGLGNRETLRALATRMPPALRGLRTQPVEVAFRLILDAMNQTFYVSDQILDVIEIHVERAIAHCELVYPSMLRFTELAYSDELELDPAPPICLTGLAGVGKSQIIIAIMRVLPPDSDVFVELCKQTFPMRSAARIVVQSKPSIRDVMGHLLPPDAPQVVRGAGRAARMRPSQDSISSLSALARAWSYRSGLALQFGDELQFVAQSAQANTRLTQILLSWWYAVVPLTYAINFSAYWKLKKRNQEDRDRLLSHRIVIRPERAGSKDWIGLLDAYQHVLSAILGFKLSDNEGELNQLTAGLKRATRDLLAIAYRGCRRAGRTKISMDDVRKAYQSTEYSEHRKDVEALIGMWMSGQFDKKRRDLWTPDDDVQTFVGARAVANNDEMDRKAAQAHIEDALTSPEKSALRRARAAAATRPQHQPHGAQVVPFPLKKSVSAEQLLRNARRDRQSRKPPNDR